MSEQKDMGEYEDTIQAAVDSWEAWKEIVSEVAERTGLTFDEALRFEAIRRMDNARAHIVAIAEVLKKHTTEEDPLREKQREMLDRLREEMDKGEDWRD